MQQITLTQKTFTKKGGSVNLYELTEDKTEVITTRQHQLTTSEDTCKWFRKLGGIETVTRAYTCAGYVPVKLVSTSPDRETKKVREFTFKWID